jgi:hypothetical protein
VVSGNARNHRASLCIFDDRFIPGLADLTKALHRAGAQVCGQLNHRGMLLCRSVLCMEPVGPSPGKNPATGDEVRALTKHDIAEIQEQFLTSAIRLYRAGYDAIELHAANGYLFQQFGDAELAPGLTVHAVGGHSAGLQFVRVKTRRGFVVLASDVTHFYENMASSRPFTTAFHIGEMLEGFDRLLALAPDQGHIVPGHDPLVMKLYPAPSPELEGVAVRLDVPPSGVAPCRATDEGS